MFGLVGSIPSFTRSFLPDRKAVSRCFLSITSSTPLSKSVLISIIQIITFLLYNNIHDRLCSRLEKQFLTFSVYQKTEKEIPVKRPYQLHRRNHRLVFRHKRILEKIGFSRNFCCPRWIYYFWGG